MGWAIKPDLRTEYDQSDYLQRDERGICYGMCRVIMQKYGSIFKGKRTLGAAYIEISKNLKTRETFVAMSKSAQDSLDQSGRPQLRPPLQEGKLYIIGLNFTIEPGYLTRYSIASYFSPAAWHSNHAALLIGIEGAVIVFEPNWGLAAWRNTPIGNLSWSDIQDLIAGGYAHNPPVYVTEIEEGAPAKPSGKW